MQLTPQQQALLDGAQGETMAKVVKTLVMYGDTFGAQRMVPVTSEYGHTVISFGLAVMKPVYDLYDRLIESGLTSGQKFTAAPLPLDKHVPTSLLEDIVFRKIMYTQQDRYEQQLKKLGITADNAYTCTCYLEQVGNTPKQGDILSWAESSAVVYANSVLGARCNRNSGMLELMGRIAGFVPEFGLLTDEGRKAHWLVEVKCTRRPEAQLLGSAIGMKVMEDVPYVRGLDKWLGTELNDENRAYLKDFGAATASNGAVGLYHVEHLTPEAKQQGEALLREGYRTYIIDDAELERVKRSYPVIWKDPAAAPQLCFVGCPHLTLEQLKDDPVFCRWLANSHTQKPPEGESGEEFLIRVQAAVAAMLDYMAQNEIFEAAVVTHGGVIATLMSTLGLPRQPLQFWKTGGGRGFTCFVNPQIWQNDHLMEVAGIVPHGAATACPAEKKG